MNKYSKGKNIGIVTAALATVALLGVGFSTWVIGTQHTETENSLSVEVDDVLYKSLRLSVTIAENDGLYFTDDSTGLKSEYFHIENDSKSADRTVSATFTITVGKDYVKEFESNCTGIKFEIETAEGVTDNKPVKDGVFTTTYADTLTYFNAPANIEKATITGGTKNVSADLVTTTYTFTQDLEFKWGSLFGNVAPFTYYDEEIKKSPNSSDPDGYAEKAYKELKAMKEKYAKAGDAAKTIKLKASLLGLTSSSTTGD